MKNSKVFVVQEQMRLDRSDNKLKPRFPLIARANSFGEIVYLLSPSAGPWRPESVLRDLRRSLKDFSNDDYLLLIGNPVLIGLTVAVAAEVNGGFVRMLQWNGVEGNYRCVEADLKKMAA